MSAKVFVQGLVYSLLALWSRMVDAFEGRIRAAVESAVTSKIMEGITRLDSFLQNLPKEIGVDNTVALKFYKLLL